MALKSRCREQKAKIKNTCCQIPLPTQMCSSTVQSKHVSRVDNSCPLKSSFVILIFFFFFNFNNLFPHCYKFPEQLFPLVLHVNAVCAFVGNQLNAPWVMVRACCHTGAAEGQAWRPVQAAACPAKGWFSWMEQGSSATAWTWHPAAVPDYPCLINCAHG